ncbi:hypothetical protein ACYPKM_02255 [Pseudomonas aeruginosa]
MMTVNQYGAMEIVNPDILVTQDEGLALHGRKFQLRSVRFLSVPRHIRGNARSFDIIADPVSDEDCERMPTVFHEAEWLSCKGAWPHSDLGFEDVVFLSLTLVGNHTYNQITDTGELIMVEATPGAFFMTDPRGYHWLEPSKPDANRNGFVCLQWVIDRDKFQVEYDRIVKGIGEHLKYLGPLNELSDRLYTSPYVNRASGSESRAITRAVDHMRYQARELRMAADAMIELSSKLLASGDTASVQVEALHHHEALQKATKYFLENFGKSIKQARTGLASQSEGA